MLDLIFSQFNYIASFILLGMGAYLLITTQNLIKKLYGLAIFQAAILLFVISLGYLDGGYSPILEKSAEGFVKRPMVNPLPQVLILTAIVVGLATLSVGLALGIRIKKEFGSVEEPF